jgi:hypothetical protein
LYFSFSRSLKKAFYILINPGPKEAKCIKPLNGQTRYSSF